jgi:hypothetical protein
MNKKAGVGIILLIIFILIVAGVGSYFLFFYESDPLQRSNFPEEISNYKIDEFTVDKNDCGELNGGWLCIDFARIEYLSNTENKAIHVLPYYVLEGREIYEDYIKENGEPFGKLYTLEEWELTWISKKYIFTVQDYDYTIAEDGSKIGEPNVVDVNNAVVKYYLNKYPPID